MSGTVGGQRPARCASQHRLFDCGDRGRGPGQLGGLTAKMPSKQNESIAFTGLIIAAGLAGIVCFGQRDGYRLAMSGLDAVSLAGAAGIVWRSWRTPYDATSSFRSLTALQIAVAAWFLIVPFVASAAVMHDGVRQDLKTLAVLAAVLAYPLGGLLAFVLWRREPACAKDSVAWGWIALLVASVLAFAILFGLN